MTLKQFLKAAIGIVLALLINATHLIFFIKYPLILICGGGGLALAFVPFQDRPLEQWLKAFFKSVYSPTIYTYKKKAPTDWLLVSDDFKKKENEAKEQIEMDYKIPVKQETKIKEFIDSLPSVQKDTVQNEPESKLEEVEIAMPREKNISDIKDRLADEKETLEKIDKLDENWRDQRSGLNLKTEKLRATGQAVFGAIPMPDKPDVPNVIVGMVLSTEEKIIEGAIVEIQDERGNPSRVLKTNSLGQFRTTTPLANGRYLVITEKDNLTFDRVNIDLGGSIVDPIKIKATV